MRPTEVRPIVETRSGKLRGQVVGGAAEFLGIPYAKPPVGERRFRAPEPPEPWSGVRDASVTGASAPQPQRGSLVTLFAGYLQKNISEDCLYLNVWTPPSAIADDARGQGQHRPVMVWLHGGAFIISSGSSFLYRGHSLVRRGDVVVVTVNYRLGALGFLDLQALGAVDDGTAGANFGIRDQIAAVEWVRDNIAAFGGDPDNVTLFGESAGAMSIGTLLGSPRAAGLFHKVILQSGAANNVSEPERAASRGRLFLDAVGLGDTAADDLLPALRELPIDTLVDAQMAATSREPPKAGQLSWQPSIDGDVVPGQPLAAIRAGEARDIEMLIGTTREEWKLFTAAMPKLRWMGRRELEKRVTALLRHHALDDEAVREALAVYRRKSPFDSLIALRSDEVFRIPAIRLAEAHAEHQPATYKYLFELPAPSMPKALGSCHALDLAFVFGTQRHPAMLPLFLGSRPAARLSRQMQDLWINFARDGVPSTDGVDWPAYDADRRATLRLGRELRIEAAPLDDERRFWEATV